MEVNVSLESMGNICYLESSLGCSYRNSSSVKLGFEDSKIQYSNSLSLHATVSGGLLDMQPQKEDKVRLKTVLIPYTEPFWVLERLKKILFCCFDNEDFFSPKPELNLWLLLKAVGGNS